MPAQHIQVAQLARQNPLATCGDCGMEAQERQEKSPAEIWTIWNGTMIYCRACAKAEGIGPED